MYILNVLNNFDIVFYRCFNLLFTFFPCYSKCWNCYHTFNYHMFILKKVHFRGAFTIEGVISFGVCLKRRLRLGEFTFRGRLLSRLYGVSINVVYRCDIFLNYFFFKTREYFQSSPVFFYHSLFSFFYFKALF